VGPKEGVKTASRGVETTSCHAFKSPQSHLLSKVFLAEHAGQAFHEPGDDFGHNLLDGFKEGGFGGSGRKLH
jgi:hypothetical protein